MRNLPNSDPFSTPSIADVNGDLSPAHLGIEETPDVEIQRSIELFDDYRNDDAILDGVPDELRELDSCKCRVCGSITSGSIIAGVEVPACDNCLIEFMVEQMPRTEIQDKLDASILPPDSHPGWGRLERAIEGN